MKSSEKKVRKQLFENLYVEEKDEIKEPHDKKNTHCEKLNELLEKYKAEGAIFNITYSNLHGGSFHGQIFIKINPKF